MQLLSSRRIPAAFCIHPSSAAWPRAKRRLDLDELNAVSGSSVAVEQQRVDGVTRYELFEMNDRAPRQRSAKDRDLDAFCLERGNDGRIVNRVGIAFEQLEA